MRFHNQLYDLFSAYLLLLQVGRVVLNALLYPGIKTGKQKNNVVAIFHTSVIHSHIVSFWFYVCFGHELEGGRISPQVEGIYITFVHCFLSVASIFFVGWWWRQQSCCTDFLVENQIRRGTWQTCSCYSRLCPYGVRGDGATLLYTSWREQKRGQPLVPIL